MPLPIAVLGGEKRKERNTVMRRRQLPKKNPDFAVQTPQGVDPDFAAGAAHFRKGLPLEACPKEFLPANTRKYYRFLLGFRAAETAQNGLKK
ncbi:MAG: hypothetical protein Q7R88_03320 [bacterium]|nr:hypothetical protein [bacterium]